MVLKIVRTVWPVMLTYVAIGAPCGMIMGQTGMEPWMVFALSSTFVTGSGQFMHKLAAARHKRAAQSKDHPGLHSRLPHDHSARRAYCNIGKHHRPDGSNDFEHHTLLILTRSPSRM